MEHKLTLKRKPSSAQKVEIVCLYLLAQKEERGGNYRAILFDVPYNVKVLFRGKSLTNRHSEQGGLECVSEPDGVRRIAITSYYKKSISHPLFREMAVVGVNIQFTPPLILHNNRVIGKIFPALKGWGAVESLPRPMRERVGVWGESSTQQERRLNA